MKNRIILSVAAVIMLGMVASSEGRWRIFVDPWRPRAIVLAPLPIPPPPPPFRGGPMPPPPAPPPVGATGFIGLNVIPADADLGVDGTVIGKALKFSDASGLLPLMPGPHAITLSRDGYKTASFTVNVIPQKTIELDITMDVLPQGVTTNAVEQPPTYKLDLDKTGYLAVKVEPQDASIYIDDTFYGITSRFSGPDSSIVLRSGNHKVDIIRPGYKSHTEIVEIKNDGAKEISIKLDKEQSVERKTP
jgi:hypothetical protein